MKLKIGLLTATGIAVAATAVGAVSQVAVAQPMPVLSQAAVEQEIAMVATQMAANPNGYTHSTLIAAEARGLTLSLHFRLKDNGNLSVEQYEAQATTGFCQNTAMRQYTDHYGVVLDINVDPPNGDGAHRFQIDRDACIRTTGVSLAPPVDQTASTTPITTQSTPRFVGSSFDFKGVPLGISYEEFYRLPHPDGYEARVVCTGDKVSILGIATDPPNVSIYNAIQEKIGVRKCIWLTTNGSQTGQSSGLRLAGSMYATYDYSFSFVPDPRDGVLRLFRFEGITNINVEDAVVQALTAKFGKADVSTGTVQNGIGNRFDQRAYVWSDGVGSLAVQSPAVEVSKMVILMTDARLEKFVEDQEAARRAAIPNGI